LETFYKIVAFSLFMM